MPLAVLAHTRPFGQPGSVGGLSPDAMEVRFRAADEDLAMLVPNARLFATTNSGHDIHQDQPALVTEAIQQVVVGVRDADTWYDLNRCCATSPDTAGGGGAQSDRPP